MPVASRIRSLRERRGFSIRALAEAAGISPATLSQIESNQTSPSVATLEKLAHGLRVPVAAFFADGEEGTKIEVIDLKDCPTFSLRDGAELIPLAAQRHESNFEPLLVRLRPGGQLAEQPFLVGIESEFVWVRRGRAVLHYDDDNFEVAEMQSVYYDPRRSHNWRNPYDQLCELLVVRQR
ncbi:MAG: XRE family transcriptional regulator [Gammaproteobacteria bacterium]|jgi:transcriptional regulator with XRE-family HTH domain